MSDVADDEGREDEEQRHHGKGRGRPHHLWREEETQSWEKPQSKILV